MNEFRSIFRIRQMLVFNVGRSAAIYTDAVECRYLRVIGLVNFISKYIAFRRRGNKASVF